MGIIFQAKIHYEVFYMISLYTFSLCIFGSLGSFFFLITAITITNVINIAKRWVTIYRTTKAIVNWIKPRSKRWKVLYLHSMTLVSSSKSQNYHRICLRYLWKIKRVVVCPLFLNSTNLLILHNQCCNANT